MIQQAIRNMQFLQPLAQRPAVQPQLPQVAPPQLLQAPPEQAGQGGQGGGDIMKMIVKLFAGG